LGFGVWRLVPADTNAVPAQGAPILQIVLVAAAILAISVASLLTDSTDIAAALLIFAVLAIALLAVAESRSGARLLPEGAMSLATPMGTMFATILRRSSTSASMASRRSGPAMSRLSLLWAGAPLLSSVQAGQAIAFATPSSPRPSSSPQAPSRCC
jgi:hypothetical protein